MNWFGYKSEVAFDDVVGSVGSVSLDGSKRGLKGQIALNRSTARVVGHHRAADVAIRIEIKRRHRHVHLRSHTNNHR